MVVRDRPSQSQEDLVSSVYIRIPTPKILGRPRIVDAVHEFENQHGQEETGYFCAEGLRSIPEELGRFSEGFSADVIDDDL